MKDLAFISGASGFLGRHVARLLKEYGCRVAGIGYNGWEGREYRDWGIDVWKTAAVTLDSLEDLARDAGEPSVFIHCAGGASVGFSLSNPHEDFLMTVSSAIDVLEFARRRAPSLRVVYPSSAAVYGSTPVLPLHEELPLNPISPYGVHKRIAEDLCRSYSANWGVPVALVRFFSLYGEGLRKQLLWDSCNKAREGNFSFFGTGDELRDWLHVQDAARLLYLSIGHAGAHCPVVNGGTGEGRSIREVLTEIGRLWSPRMVPEFCMGSKPGDPCHLVADARVAKSWGFEPQTSLNRGLAAYVRWFRAECGL